MKDFTSKEDLVPEDIWLSKEGASEGPNDPIDKNETLLDVEGLDANPNREPEEVLINDEGFQKSVDITNDQDHPTEPIEDSFQDSFVIDSSVKSSIPNDKLIEDQKDIDQYKTKYIVSQYRRKKLSQTEVYVQIFYIVSIFELIRLFITIFSIM